jgi:DNA-binding YbaB/EbfC family protein
MMKQAQELQKRMAEMQERLQNYEIEGTSGGGMVKATVTGKGELKALKIDPSLVDPKEVDVLEDLIIAAFNDGKGKVEAHLAKEMSSVTGGMPLPGGFKLPF